MSDFARVFLGLTATLRYASCTNAREIYKIGSIVCILREKSLAIIYNGFPIGDL